MFSQHKFILNSSAGIWNAIRDKGRLFVLEQVFLDLDHGHSAGKLNFPPLNSITFTMKVS